MYLSLITLTIKVVALFILPSATAAVIFARIGLVKQLGNRMSLLLAYATGPLLLALLFLYSLYILPSATGWTYVAILTGAQLVILVALRKSIKHIWHEHVHALKDVWVFIQSLPKLLTLIMGVMLLLYFVQGIVYPIVDNDNGAYLNQSEAIYENLNVTWRQDRLATIREDDVFDYNPMIRPALPHFMAYSFLFGRNDLDYTIKQLLTAYYYLVLLSAVVFMARLVAKEQGKPENAAAQYAAVFLVFSWVISRGLIFSTKESIIYSLAVLSCYLLYRVLTAEKRTILLELALGLVLGLNAFINFHGIIIACIILLLYVVMSRETLRNRIAQLITIVASLHIFSAGEFFGFYLFKRLIGIAVAAVQDWSEQAITYVYQKIDTMFHSDISGRRMARKVARMQDVTTSNLDQQNIAEFTSDDEGHEQLYQFNDTLNVYLRGKLQIFTNVAYFGVYFWAFVTAAVLNMRNFTQKNYARLILAFIFVYFIVVIDILSLNPIKNAVVLSGSSKYPALLLVLSISITAAYMHGAMEWLLEKVARHGKVLAIGLGVLALLSAVLFNPIGTIATDVLTQVIPVHKSIDYYRNIINILIISGVAALVFLAVCSIVLAIGSKRLKLMARVGVISALFAGFVMVPMLAAPVGKVQLWNTFSFVFTDRFTKLENTINYSDRFIVYSYAKKHLSQGTSMVLSSNELFTYDEYFSLVTLGSIKERLYTDEPEYTIRQGGCTIGEEIYHSGKSFLCTYK